MSVVSYSSHIQQVFPYTARKLRFCNAKQELIFLRAFAILRKDTISFAMSVRLSVPNNSAHTTQLFMKTDVRGFCEN